jgi:hypothetical protein
MVARAAVLDWVFWAMERASYLTPVSRARLWNARRPRRFFADAALDRG